jgi:hypothetical protein
MIDTLLGAQTWEIAARKLARYGDVDEQINILGIPDRRDEMIPLCREVASRCIRRAASKLYRHASKDSSLNHEGFS